MKRYVIAVRRGAVPPANWQQRIAGRNGVSNVAAMPARIQVNASDEAIEEVRQEFGDGLEIEEIAGREPLN